jgi:hypothetical protein
MYSYNEVVDRLRNEILTVTFMKVDGSERVMNCTLLPQYLPEDARYSGSVLSEEAGNAVRVWDIGVGSWRSFRLDSIKSVKSSNG